MTAPNEEIIAQMESLLTIAETYQRNLANLLTYIKLVSTKPNITTEELQMCKDIADIFNAR